MRKIYKERNTFSFKNGFTLIELLVVIGISSWLTTVIYTNFKETRETSSVLQAGLIQKEMTKATEKYFRDMGFYPPDVNRGWDPGFEQPVPWNPDVGQPGVPVVGIVCTHCPADWEDVVSEHWAGPYLNWPRETPWGGRFDYNYWSVSTTRSGGCVVPAGIYAGAQGDYQNSNTIPLSAEDKMIEKGFDADECENGESQLLLWRL